MSSVTNPTSGTGTNTSTTNTSTSNSSSSAANSSASSAAGAGSSNTATATAGLNSNYQQFLTLLTTQLQNQDPTAPADTNELTQEIASLSQVQQQINTNSLLQQLVTAFSSSQLNANVSYIGKQIDATGNQVNLSGGQAALVYTLPANAASATVTITDSSGKTLFSGPGTTASGRNQMLWNGVNSTTNATMPDGAYNFTVTAKDSSGNALTTTTYTSGIVTAIDSESGTASLSLGNGISVPLSNVQSVYTANANPDA